MITRCPAKIQISVYATMLKADATGAHWFLIRFGLPIYPSPSFGIAENPGLLYNTITFRKKVYFWILPASQHKRG
jgi:hypothetical protein